MSVFVTVFRGIDMGGDWGVLVGVMELSSKVSSTKLIK